MGGCYNKFARTEIAGMLFEASKKTDLCLRIRRKENPIWSIDFIVKPTSPSDEVYIGQNILMTDPNYVSINVYYGENSTHCKMYNIKITGNLEAAKHDCCLLRMFSSEWSE